MKKEKFVAAHKLGRKQYAVVHIGYKKVIDDMEFFIYKDKDQWFAVHGDSGQSICKSKTIKGTVKLLEEKVERNGLMKFLRSKFMESVIEDFQDVTVIAEQKWNWMNECEKEIA